MVKRRALAGADTPAQVVEALFARTATFAPWEALIFEPNARAAAKAALPEGAKRSDFPFVYFSERRPLTAIPALRRAAFGNDVVMFNYALDDGQPAHTGAILAREPLPLAVLEQYELTAAPGAWLHALATLVEGRRLPVEIAFTNAHGEPEVYLVFRNPRGLWQVSHFDEHGPTGHVEERALAEALKHGFPMLRAGRDRIQIDAGVLDELAPCFTYVGGLAGWRW